ncbi:MAG: DUF4942 domain-containing protein [Helicobacter sp.]|nr:DUF4942 domain-containing protein [Helicobacter sp.]
MSSYELINNLKKQEEDFEWYPTTDSMIETIKERFKKVRADILDIGAGDGRVLKAFGGSNLFAIEKSQLLVNTMPKDVLVVGSDFYSTSLIEKRFDLVFCNPPYSEYKQWAMRILRECNTQHIALIIPSRWREDVDIQLAMQERKDLEYEILASSDFLNAERKARAKVDIVFFTLSQYDDIFTQSLERQFGLDELFTKLEKAQYDFGTESEEKENLQAQCKEVAQGDLIDFLVQRYNDDIQKYIKTIESLKTIDYKILASLNIDREKLIKGIKKQLRDLKNLYWSELFNKLDSLTNRITSKYRAHISCDIAARNEIEFNKPNIYNVVIWAIKNADEYMKQGYLDLFERMAEGGNALEYKSNHRFKTDSWRYTLKDNQHKAHKLDYRIVVTNEAIEKTQYYKPQSVFLQDLRVVARNLGFNIDYIPYIIYAGEQSILDYCDSEGCKTFFEARGYHNRNAHFKFNKEFMASLNIAVGRLCNWIKNKQEAKEEFKDVSSEIINSLFSKPLGLPLQESLKQLALLD